MGKNVTGLRRLYDFFLTAAILVTATVLCTLLRRLDSGGGYVHLIFVLAVATISRWTEGFFWGIFSSVTGVLLVNYVFTYPYWEFNFTITGNTAAILDNEGSFSPEQKRCLLEDVNEDAQWLIRMVENLLSITRMSGGQARIEKDCEAAEEIVAVSVSKFTKRFPSINVSVEVPDEVLMVPMDATLIRQVIMNLLENAAIHGEGVKNIRVRLSREGNLACFTVSDDGVGIPKEKLANIFQGGLSEVSHSNFDMKKNMGIGLSVCYTIVKAHGGTMTAENLETGGACFRFYLPMEEGKTSEAEG